MARKRANKKVEKAVVKKLLPKTTENKHPVASLSQADVSQFEELIQLSSTVAKIRKSMADKEHMITGLNNIAKRIQNKEIKAPLMQEILPQIYAPYYDLDEVVKKINQNVLALRQAIGLERGQLDHRYEEYVSALIRLRNVFNSKIGDSTATIIPPHRRGVNGKEATVLFEKNLDEKMTDDDKKALKDAMEKIKSSGKK